MILLTSLAKKLGETEDLENFDFYMQPFVLQMSVDIKGNGKFLQNSLAFSYLNLYCFMMPMKQCEMRGQSLCYQNQVNNQPVWCCETWIKTKEIARVTRRARKIQVMCANKIFMLKKWNSLPANNTVIFPRVYVHVYVTNNHHIYSSNPTLM